ncbi:acetate/propionate family kinase [Candidatus Falkowbacteria bacterium]|uniref:Acetate kinase n=1 Tax=Candidatus Buchananbacteria bacterium CG10_big_fil_rev_8_21_14_0_10_33_19 TaxID=1974525 RepID=A0A2H0W3U9_9BACT|nr:acetate/propionate family kinase [Candidatus Falkowbacteria bacterium]PIS06035.1 MAG: acetate kinase [Candidatus Buchananbacteria bacterium CG10_big_fil_rev_8_21_14_0_10_33_19]
MKKILVINSGSATLKFKVFSASNLSEELSGIVERIGLKNSFMSVDGLGKDRLLKKYPPGILDYEQALAEVLLQLKTILPDIKLVGHRVVHGGGTYNQPLKLNQGIINKLAKYNKLAPLHNPINLACAESALKLLPQAKHVAVFDTAYYADIPEYIHRYALPSKFYKLGIRRYGFHGLSHQYSAIEGAKKAKLKISKAKIITCHLGSGCSITATKNGLAIDTTMGFTPLEGLTMSTRAGDLDASIPLYMINELKMSTSEITKVFNQESGLLAIAGTMDMREILLASGHKVLDYSSNKIFTDNQKAKAQLALDMFVYDVVRYIGQLAISMDGVDLIVFTGGIGERSPAVRKIVLDKIRHLSKFKNIVIEANEELMIAREIVKTS